jgi:hypothetical protein
MAAKTIREADLQAVWSDLAVDEAAIRSKWRRVGMSGLGPRRLAVAGFLASFAGAVLDVTLVAAAGGGLSGGYIAGIVGGYVFYGCVALIAIGAAVAGGAQRTGGVALMLLPALFHLGFLIGSQLSLWLLIIPTRN